MASRSEIFGWLALLILVVPWGPGWPALLAQGRDGRPVGIPRDGRRPGSAGLIPSAADVPATADAVIEEMSQIAGVVFAGQVMGVRRPTGFAGSDEDAGQGIVEVDFRVEEAVRGPVAGSVYTLREWSGLWSASGGGARYRAGRRLLVFLYEPDAHGLSSPVHGPDGAVPLRGGGVAPTPDGRPGDGPDSTTVAAAQWMVDLRWVQARALRSGVLVMMPPVRRPVPRGPIQGRLEEEGILQNGERIGAAFESEADHVRRVPLPAAGSTAIVLPLETEPLSQVLALCHRSTRRDYVGR